MSNIRRFCGLAENGTFEVYLNKDRTFGRCFLWTTFSSVSHVFLALVSSYLLGLSKKICGVGRSCSIVIATAIAMLSMLVVLAELVLSYSLHQRHQHPPAYVLARTITFTSWFSCFLFCWKCRVVDKRTRKNFKIILLVVIFVLLSSSMQLQYVDQHIAVEQFSIADIPVDFFGVIVGFTLNLSFFLCCIWLTISDVVVQDSSEQLVDEIESSARKTIQIGRAESTGNYLSKLTFWWVNLLLRKGIRGELNDPDDLFSLPENLETNKIRDIAMINLQHQKHKVLNELATTDNAPGDMVKYKEISLFSMLNKCFGRVYYGIGMLKFLSIALQLMQPILVNLLVSYVTDKDEPLIDGIYYAAAFLLTSLFSVLFDLHYRYQFKKTNLRVRAALITMIYEKTLQSRSIGMSGMSSGNIVNLMSSDTDQVRNFCDNFHECWAAPAQLIVCLYLLYQQVGIAFLAPIAYIILILPIAQQMSKKILDNESKILTERDARIKLLCEVLFGIRIIKYNVWENHFAEAIGTIRSRELKLGLVVKLVIAAVSTLWSMTTSIMLLLTIGTYIGLGNSLSAAKVFTTMAVINQLANPLNSLSWNMNALLDAWVSLKRIQRYLSLPDICLKEYYAQGNPVSQTDNTDVNVEQGTFSWNGHTDSDVEGKGCTNDGCSGDNKENLDSLASSSANIKKPFLLTDISVHIKRGQFIGIVGKVGSGKSSLFASITAEIEKQEGAVYLSHLLDKEGIALFTQEPWIQHLSIRDNILFGRPYDDEKYNDVMHACALHEDIALFPAGDLTEVGEKGVNLSGGQKARIALARAVYQDKGMYLLDDPIAAVDAHVAKHVYNNCIMGLLREKTRVLITHHATYLYQADHVVLLEDGKIAAQGRPDEILKNVGSLLVEDIEEIQNKSNGDEKQDTKNIEDLSKSGQLVEEEDKQIGSVSFGVYKLYCQSCGSFMAAMTLFIMAIALICAKMQDWWLAHWVEESPNVLNDSHLAKPLFTSSTIYSNLEGGLPTDYAYYFSIYGYFALGYFVFLGSGAYLFAFGTFRGSTFLHNSLLDAVMTTPVSFFDATPVGRIVNRFSSDISGIDSEIGFFLQMCVTEGFFLIGQVIIMCVSLPWFTLFLVPMGLLYYWIQRTYRISSRELKRISSIARSPIYEHFTETLSGCMTIRAYREANRFSTTNQLKLDQSQRAEYNQDLAALWLTFQLNLIGVMSVAVVALLAVLEHQYGTTNGGLVGLAVTYSIQITPSLSWLLTVFTETEKQMVHVERVQQYIDNTPTEVKKEGDVHPQWPHEGKIEFDCVNLTYREDLPYALKEVSFNVSGGEKIGICGRTGSGKSTLLKVLFSIIDVTTGSVYIDGLNISDIDHSILRSRMSIIPQDPFLFDDTVSRNLDPTGHFSTNEMLEVVRKCHLSMLVENLGGLDGKVGERGNKLSNGQKQLLCLARALLRKSRIICIDEATASVDFETDKLIQETICDEFSSSTVLTIAHRMHTIIDSDRILVMDMGKVKEMDTPQALLEDINSEFFALVNENMSQTTS